MTRFLPVLLICLAILQGCAKEDRDPCLQPRTTVLRARTMQQDDTAGAPIRDTLLPRPLLRPLGVDSPYILTGRRISTFSFSLSNVADSCRWVIRPDSAIALEDTLTFYYQRQLRFLSNACGYTNFYNLQRVHTTRHAIDSVLILRPDITSDANVEHLRIKY